MLTSPGVTTAPPRSIALVRVRLRTAADRCDEPVFDEHPAVRVLGPRVVAGHDPAVRVEPRHGGSLTGARGRAPCADASISTFSTTLCCDVCEGSSRAPCVGRRGRGFCLARRSPALRCGRAPPLVTSFNALSRARAPLETDVRRSEAAEDAVPEGRAATALADRYSWPDRPAAGRQARRDRAGPTGPTGPAGPAGGGGSGTRATRAAWTGRPRRRNRSRWRDRALPDQRARPQPACGSGRRNWGDRARRRDGADRGDWS